ncbi:hypothetical protein [Streptomyces sp. NPDC046727]|uniref:hypothetical protein n=1 Tax=Streptomyces sp. NPDC046727 TaxID=3155373 RepID=UPI0034060ADD
MLVRAYVLFEVDPAGDDVLERLTQHSLAGCKVLAREIYPHEIVAGLEAERLEDFNAAVSELAGEAGVLRATTLRISTSP